MAEHRLRFAARFAEMEERRNKQFDRIDFLLEALLQKHNCSQSSFRGARNSCQETLLKPFRSNHISPVAESSREFHQRMAELLREIKQDRFVTRGDRGLEVTESTNSSLRTSTQTISSTEPIDEQFADESVGVRTSMVIEVSESLDNESLPILNEIGSEVDAAQSLFVDVVTPVSDLIDEQSIVDESIAVRNLPVEEVMSMSEILGKPLVRMPIIHQDGNHPLTNLMYSTLECLSCARLNDQILLPPPKPPDPCFRQMHVEFQVKCSRIMHPPHPESLDSRHMFVKMLSRCDIATWDPLNIQNQNSWQFSVLTPSTLMKVCGDAFILDIVVEEIAHRYILPTTATVIYCLLGVVNSLQTQVRLTPFVTMMKISFKIATMRLISSNFSTCKMVVIYPLNDVIEQEASSLSNLHRGVIVSAMVKIEKQLAVVVKLSIEEKLRDVASWDGHAFWKNFSDTFESLKVHFLGRNKEYVEKFLPTVEVLVVKWTQKEGTLIHRNFQKTMLENCLIQAVEDQENSFICAEFATVRAMLLRLKEAIEEQRVVKQVYVLYDVKGVLEEFARIIELQQVTILNAFVLGIYRPYCFDEASNWIYTMIKNDIGTIVVCYYIFFHLPTDMGNMDLFLVVFPQKLVSKFKHNSYTVTHLIACQFLGAIFSAALTLRIMVHEGIGIKVTTPLCVVSILPLLFAKTWCTATSLLEPYNQPHFSTIFAAIQKLMRAKFSSILVIEDFMSVMFGFWVWLLGDNVIFLTRQSKKWDPGGCSLVHEEVMLNLELTLGVTTLIQQLYLHFNLEVKVDFKGDGNVMINDVLTSCMFTNMLYIEEIICDIKVVEVEMMERIWHEKMLLSSSWSDALELYHVQSMDLLKVDSLNSQVFLTGVVKTFIWTICNQFLISCAHFKQWDHGQHLEMGTTICFFKFKQCDPGKICAE